MKRPYYKYNKILRLPKTRNPKPKYTNRHNLKCNPMLISKTNFWHMPSNDIRTQLFTKHTAVGNTNITLIGLRAKYYADQFCYTLDLCLVLRFSKNYFIWHGNTAKTINNKTKMSNGSTMQLQRDQEYVDIAILP